MSAAPTRKSPLAAALFCASVLLSPILGYAQPRPSTAPLPSAKLASVVKEIAPSAGAKTPDDKELSAYLFVFFRDDTHSLYFATSRDGYTFTAVNNGQPILLGKDLAEQKGIRDPHVLRGPDGGFYLSMTDLHVFGKREGIRTTEWERDGKLYSWGNNRALIFMKSFDLVNWTHSIVHVGELFPEFGDIGCAWAPQTVVDPSNGKLMVYYTTRIKNGPNIMVYSYANSAFTTLETAPKILFNYPKPNVNTIDADITKIGDKYHMFYVAHDNPGGIRHAVSDKINQDYVYEPDRVDGAKVACEAPNLWKRHGTNTYVLMYDIFGVNPHNMGFSETEDFKTFRSIGRFNDPNSPMKATNFSSPKHGTIIPITPAEADKLEAYFSGGK